MKKLAILAAAVLLLAPAAGCGKSASASGSEYIYGQIDSVSGNDIVLLLADYNENADSGSDSAEKEKKSEDSGSERKRPDKGNLPEDFDSSEFSKRQSGSSKYTLTGEQKELRIQVGTTVTTAAGVKTDFDVLKAGDYIKCSITTDSDGQTVITSVQIMEA
ncbi:MAG: hypothetical protein IKI58_03330 [Oscillospiraceae bacterium]|nr:hypothetical protein [Oscillospiraceae bacterium]